MASPFLAPTLILLLALLFPLPHADTPPTPRPEPQRDFASESSQSNGRLPPAATATPTNDPLQFPLVGKAETYTGDGLVAIELPLVATVCTVHNLQTALAEHLAHNNPAHAADIKQDLATVMDANRRIDNVLWTLKIDGAIKSSCQDPRYKLSIPRFVHAIRTDFPPHQQSLKETAAQTIVHKVQKRSPEHYRQTRALPIATTLLLQLGKAAGDNILQRTKAAGVSYLAEKTKTFLSKAAKLDEDRNPNQQTNVLKTGGNIISAVAMWFFNRGKYNGLSARIDEVESTMGLNTVATRFAIQAVMNVEEKLFTGQLADMARRTADDIVTLGNKLAYNRMDVSLVEKTQLAAALETLAVRAKQQRQELLDSSVMALIQQDISYLLERNTGLLTLYIKVPLVSPHLKLKIYRFVQAPLPTKSGLLQLKTSYHYLAVTTTISGSFVGLTEQDFAKCTYIQGIFLCPFSRMLLKQDASLRGRDDQRCLYATFKSISEDMRAYCQFEPSAHNEVMLHTAGQKFLHYSARPTSLETECGDGRLQFTTLPPGHVIIELQEGCSAQSKSVVFWIPSTIGEVRITAQPFWPTPQLIKDITAATKEHVDQLLHQQQTWQEVTATPPADPATSPPRPTATTPTSTPTLPPRWLQGHPASDAIAINNHEDP
jgi:hypothetical protein